MMPYDAPSPALREAIVWLYDAVAASSCYRPEFEFLRAALGQNSVRAGSGRASGEGRAREAAQRAIESFGEGLSESGFLLAAICASDSLAMQEFSKAATLIERAAQAQTLGGPDMQVEMTIDDTLGEEMRVILMTAQGRPTQI